MSSRKPGHGQGPWEGSAEEAGQGEAGKRLDMLPLGSRGLLKASSGHQPLQRTLQHGN